MKKNILILDDDQDILDVIKLALNSLPVVPILKDNHVTLGEIEALNPDLILLDHWLPFTSGGDLCRQIKSHAATEHIPVLLVSAVVNLPELAAFCKADGYVTKPFDLQEFVGKIKEFLP